VTVVGDFVLNSADTLAIDVDGTAGPGAVSGHDQVNVTGSVDLGGARLTLGSTAQQLTVAAGTELTIIDNDSAIDPVVGTFIGLAEGDTVVAGDQVFTISYTGGDGNDVTLTPSQAQIVAGPAIVEFGDVETSQSEDGVGSVPQILVLGDLTNTPEAQRRVDFSLTPGSAQSGVNDDFSLASFFIVPAANYTSVTPFDLTQFGTDGNPASATNPAVLVINEDTLIEGVENFSLDFNGIGGALTNDNGNLLNDLDNDGSVRDGTTHNIVDNDIVRVSIVPDPASVTEGGTVGGDVVVETSSDGGSTFDNSATIAPGATVSFTVQDANSGTAGVGADFSFVDGTITLDSSSVFTADNDIEVVNITSTAGLSTSDPVNSQVQTVDGTITIVDNDIAVWTLTQR